MKNYFILVAASFFLMTAAVSCNGKKSNSEDKNTTNVEQSGEAPASEKYLKMAEEVNKHTPVTIMDNIQLDKAEALKGNIFKYYYTFMEDPKPTSEQFITITKPMIIPMLKNSEEMQEMKKDNITIVYAYHKKDKSLFAEIKITPDEY